MNDKITFALHAPEVPYWFFLSEQEPHVPHYMEVPQQSTLYAELKGIFSDDLDPAGCSAEAQAWVDNHNAQDAQHAAWVQAAPERRFFAWRLHYAERMTALFAA